MKTSRSWRFYDVFSDKLIGIHRKFPDSYEELSVLLDYCRFQDFKKIGTIAAQAAPLRVERLTKSAGRPDPMTYFPHFTSPAPDPTLTLGDYPSRARRP